MAQLRMLLPVRRISHVVRRMAWSALAAGIALASLTPAVRASSRPPLNGLPVIHPGFGVPDEPDAPAQGGMLKPLYRPTLTVSGPPPRGGSLSIAPLQTVRTFKTRRFWR